MRGVRFIFRIEPGHDVLHIYARHLTTPVDAIRTFFAGHPERTVWNEQHRRFETYTDTHGLFWFWRDEGRTVMVISCFRV